MLTAEVPEFTRPTCSRMIFGLFPAAAIWVGLSINLGMVGDRNHTDPTNVGKTMNPVLATVVLELFTSQGCSSCPPADALLIELAKSDDVLALSFHVDYWNQLGWKDPWSAAEWTARQRRYAAVLGERRVYTPQLVVNGSTGFVGSSRTQATSAIESARARKSDDATVTLAPAKAKGGGWEIAIEVATSAKRTRALRVDAIVLQDGLVTEIEAGENGGRTLANDGVVRKLVSAGEIPVKHVGPWNRTITLPEHPGKSVRLAVIVQDVETLAIAGASVVPAP